MGSTQAVGLITQPDPDVAVAADQAALDAVDAKAQELQQVHQEGQLDQKIDPNLANPPPAAVTEVPVEGAPKLAGKYNSRDELISGINNARKTLGFTAEYEAGDQPDVYLEGHYKALESQIGVPGGTPAEAAPAKPADALKIPDAVPRGADGLFDMETLAQEYIDNGNSFTEVTLKDLESKGISRNMAQTYMYGQEAIGREAQSAAFKIAGGEEAYTEMLSWSQAHLSTDQKESFNNSVNGSTADMELAVGGLWALYRSANPEAPNLAQGNAATTPLSTGAFQSLAEWKEAMRDPRYQNDPAYRNEVDAKLAAADKAGNL